VSSLQGLPKVQLQVMPYSFSVIIAVITIKLVSMQASNWPYVVLSCVCSLDGMYIQDKTARGSNFVCNAIKAGISDAQFLEAV
jgi:hypothetical protein